MRSGSVGRARRDSRVGEVDADQASRHSGVHTIPGHSVRTSECYLLTTRTWITPRSSR